MRPIQKEVYQNGDLIKIEVVDSDTSEHIFDALWDPRDEQTEENRKEFRRWVDQMIKRKVEQNEN
jgi:hypothetical protein